MRVRESLPDDDDILEHYQLTPLRLIARLEGLTVGEVLGHYLSKVGTWRSESKFRDHLAAERMQPFAQANDMASVEAAFWTDTWKRLEGAPAWLSESFLLYWQAVLADLMDTYQSAELLESVLESALRFYQEPRELP